MSKPRRRHWLLIDGARSEASAPDSRVAYGCWPRSVIWESAQFPVRQVVPTTGRARGRNAPPRKSRIFADASDPLRIGNCPPRSSRRSQSTCEHRRRSPNPGDKDPESIRNCISPAPRGRNAIFSTLSASPDFAVDVFHTSFPHAPRNRLRASFDALNNFNYLRLCVLI